MKRHNLCNAVKHYAENRLVRQLSGVVKNAIQNIQQAHPDWLPSIAVPSLTKRIVGRLMDRTVRFQILELIVAAGKAELDAAERILND